MSAREDVEALLRCHGVSKTARQSVQILMGDYAHELAEKIRNSERLRDFTDDHMSDMYEAANEIDPEVSG